jgi:hypothetical protein
VPALLPVHIIAAAIGLVAGSLALAAGKGGRLHRGSGTVFVYAMFGMCGAAIVLAVMKAQAANVMAGTMTAYLAFTGMTTVRAPSPTARQRDIALMLLALMLGVATFATGVVALTRPTGRMFGLPSLPFFLFGVLGMSGAAGDFKTMRGAPLQGGRRLSRHLWRMCMAMFITTASFFSIRARVAAVLPAPFTTPAMRALPVLAVLAVMFYWLWRVRSRRLKPAARWSAIASMPAEAPTQ